MLRELQVQELRPVKAQFKAASDMVVGMGVVIDRSNGTVKKPTAATSVNIYVVDKERDAKGKNNVKKYFSDRFTDFVNISEGENVKIHTYDVGDVFATDQTANINTLAAASYAKVGTDGKWAVSSDPTKYKVVGVYNDAGNPMVEIEIVEVEPVTELPAAGTNGNVLTANNGEWVSAAPASQLPAVTAEDAGDVLTVNESGVWAAAEPSGGSAVLAVSETVASDVGTLNKTAAEIMAADIATVASDVGYPDVAMIIIKGQATNGDGHYYFYIMTGNGNLMQWTAATSADYPTRDASK